MGLRLSKPSQVRLRRSGCLAVTSGAGTPSVGGSPGTGVLSLTEPLDQRVYQRVGTSKIISVSGSFTGTVTQAQMRAVPVGTAITDTATVWTDVPTDTSAKTFAGTLNVPQGGWYVWQVRDKANTATNWTGTKKFGVGMVIAKIGQSNLVNEQTTVSKYPLGDPKAVEWNGSAFIRVGNVNDAFAPNTLFGTYSSYTAATNNGDAHVFFANLMSEGLGIPVCIVNKAVGGSAVSEWQSGTNNWNAFTSAINAAGGDFELCIWYQGETDAHAFTPSTYKSQVANIHANCKSLTGRTDSNFKFGVVSLGPGYYLGSVEGDFGKMRVTQIEYAMQTAGAFLAGCNYDAATGSADFVHIGGEGFNRIGRRYAKNALYQYGIGASGAGPKITGATRSGATITVAIAHSGGTSLADGNGGNGSALTGFRVFDGGVQATISSTAISGNTVVLTLGAVPAGAVTLDHAIMNAPSGTDAKNFNPAGTVYDNATYYNSTIGCPLQPCAAITVS